MSKNRRAAPIYVPISIHVVVERELLILLYPTLGEDAHPDSLSYSPFCDITIRRAGMIREAPDATPLGCVDEFILLKHHEVEVLDPFVGVLAHAFLE